MVFSIASYRKTRINFLANPILLLFSLGESVKPFPAHHWPEYRWKEIDGDCPVGEDHWGRAGMGGRGDPVLSWEQGALRGAWTAGPGTTRPGRVSCSE